MAYLILARHGITEWNAAGKWQGLTDIPLSEEGKRQAKEMAGSLKGIRIDLVYTSELSRVKQTSEEICNSLGLICPVAANPALNERDYGIYTGKNKWEMENELGQERFTRLRRGWDFPVPEGETLKDVYNRVVPFYREKILPDLQKGKNVLAVAHGNSLRALVKFLENISDENIAKLEIPIGQILVYSVDNSGKIIDKQILNS
ncbi:MAG: 2,3-bisphosphoglycerate-dependent phosphoglycerate mutase [Patescibacteria group bacterium]|nr:2,3-bisphosphoglycerate-dependent phosphoglycerate mutase [Patescibacteria group bacterium]